MEFVSEVNEVGLSKSFWLNKRQTLSFDLDFFFPNGKNVISTQPLDSHHRDERHQDNV